MDVRMPGIGGLEATRKICLNHFLIHRIIAVTVCNDDGLLSYQIDWKPVLPVM